MPTRDTSRKRWRAQVRWRGRIYRADFLTKKEAVAWEAQKRSELEREAQEIPIQTGMDLVSFCNEYLDFAQLHFVSRTYKNKKRFVKMLIDHLGNVPVNEIIAHQIHDFLSKKTPSPSKFNEVYKHLRAMWAWGIDFLGLERNPVAKIKRLPHDRQPQYTPPTEDILKVLIAANREERIFLNCYLHTGARRSEIFRWTWDDINFEKREVRLGTRKTKDGSMEYEWLPMSDELHSELWSWWKDRPIKNTPYVFVSTSNRHYGVPFTTRRQFMKGLCKRADVKQFGFHALRRYCASLLADTHKISAKTIQRILRHKNVTTTERYIHNINRDLGGVMNLFSEKSTQEEHPKNSQEG